MARYSQQRENILLNLQGRKDHPTADMVYEGVKEIQPNISLGTVYRNLNLLAECGDIIKLSCDGKSERFDGNIEPHYHIMCTECGNVMDLDMEPLNHINILAESAFEGTVQDHVIYFKGICKKCLKGIDTVDK